jgi:hypothetical protein
MKSLLLLLLCAAPAAAQVNRSVTGVITESTSAAAAGAQVPLTLIDTGVTTRTVTNTARVYRFPSAPIGRYELRVSPPGFQTFVRQSIVVETHQSVRVDATLELGAMQESVTVTADDDDFGRITGPGAARIIQPGFRVDFRSPSCPTFA